MRTKPGTDDNDQEEDDDNVYVEKTQTLKTVTDISGSWLQHRLYLILRNKYEFTV